MTVRKHSNHPAEQDSSNAGFTLLELIVVLLIAGAALTIAASSGRNSMARPALDAAASRLAATLRMTHALAIRTNEDQFVLFDPDGNTYSAPSTSGLERLPRNVAVVIEKDGLGWDGSKRLIRFRPDGTATSAVFALSHPTGRSRITLNGLTGSVRLNPERP